MTINEIVVLANVVRLKTSADTPCACEVCRLAHAIIELLGVDAGPAGFDDVGFSTAFEHEGRTISRSHVIIPSQYGGASIEPDEAHLFAVMVLRARDRALGQ